MLAGIASSIRCKTLSSAVMLFPWLHHPKPGRLEHDASRLKHDPYPLILGWAQPHLECDSASHRPPPISMPPLARDISRARRRDSTTPAREASSA